MTMADRHMLLNCLIPSDDDGCSWANDSKSVRCKSIILGQVTSPCISVFMWLHFGHLLMLENLPHKLGTVSPQLSLSEAWLWEIKDGFLDPLCP